GAKIGRSAHVHSSVRIWAPWNLEMGDHSCLGCDVDCYSVARIRLAPHATVSQYSFLCTASHDIERLHLPLIAAPIDIGEGAWIVRSKSLEQQGFELSSAVLTMSAIIARRHSRCRSNIRGSTILMRTKSRLPPCARKCCGQWRIAAAARLRTVSVSKRCFVAA